MGRCRQVRARSTGGGRSAAGGLTEIVDGCCSGGMTEPVDDERDIERAWKAEIRRRVEAVRSGEAIFVNGDAALASIRARIAEHQKTD